MRYINKIPASILLMLAITACTEDINKPEYSDYGVINMNASLGSPAVTRATEADQSSLESVGSNFMAWGYFSPETTGETPGSLYMGDSHTVGTVINYGTSGWRYFDPTKIVYWPSTIPLNFQAVTPHDYGTIVNTPADNVPRVAMRVTVPADNSLQEDLLFGHEEEVTGATHGGSANLSFEHAMSQIAFRAMTSLDDMTVVISGVTIHNVRNTATVGYTGSLTGSRRKLAVSDYASTTGDYPIGMASPSVTVDSDVPVTLNATDGLLMLLPQSGTDTPDAWDTTTETPVTVATANTAGAEKSYLQVSCKIRYGDTYILGSASADDNVYIPMKADWEIGKRYTYTLDFSGDGSFSVDGSPSLTKICCITTEVEEWDTETVEVADMSVSVSPYKLLTDLPAVYIETEGKVAITSKEDYLMCETHYVDEDGKVTDYASVGVKGRGNSTWGLAKKPYRLKFDSKVKLLGNSKANAKKWNLLANAGDKTMIRNALTFALGEFAGLPFNPSTKFVDLVINGTYMGLYQITDQMEVRKKRVDITEQPVPLTEGFDISGGYLMEVDGFKDGNWFSTSTYNAPVRIRYPDEDDIVASQNTYIRGHVNAFETALSSASFTDPETGYRAYVDEATLINWYLCTEISANIDGFWSTYFYKKQGDPKLYWGPLWDYDIAYDNDTRKPDTYNKLMADMAYDGSRAWVVRMWQDPWFKNAVNTRYRELLDAGLVSFMLGKVDELKAVVNTSQAKNYEKWGIGTKMYHERVMRSTYDEYINDLKTFITNHCAWLETEFASRAGE